jgi:hypothetical protein
MSHPKHNYWRIWKQNTMVRNYHTSIEKPLYLTTLETLSVVIVILVNSTNIFQDRFHEAVVNLSTGQIESNVRLGANVHGNADYEEVLMIEKRALEDQGVQEAIAKLQLPEGTVVCADPCFYGRSLV